MFFVTFLPFLCYVEKRQHYRMYSTEKYKSQAQTKGHWTAGYLSSHQPRCQLIAADILPMLLFQSKMFWCIAFFCFFTKRGHGSERPSSLSISIFNKIAFFSHSFALTMLSSFLNTANTSNPCMEGKSQLPQTWLPAGKKKKKKKTLNSQEESQNSN